MTLQPKPGPHLAAVPPPVSPPPIKRSFRDLARMHALMAVDYLAEAQSIEPGAAGTSSRRLRDDLLALADVAAHVSLAASHVAPPARARYTRPATPADHAPTEDPTVEIAYLKATVADLKAERDDAKAAAKGAV
mgnify:CR=1 FL=1